jgi:hypothetical protein
MSRFEGHKNQFLERVALGAYSAMATFGKRSARVKLLTVNANWSSPDQSMDGSLFVFGSSQKSSANAPHTATQSQEPTMRETETVAGKTLAEWREFARRDDCLERMVPSDLRQLIGKIPGDGPTFKAGSSELIGER